MCQNPPVWQNAVGLYTFTHPDHDSIGVRLNWGPAKPFLYTDQVFYNIYYSTSRFGVFTEGPKLMTTARYANVPITLPGNINYFGVRATEFDPTFFDITQLQQVGPSLYQYPEKPQLTNSIDAYSLAIPSSSIFGFPNAGFLLLNYEVIQYNSISDGYFIVPSSGRGAYMTTPVDHTADAYMSLFHGIEDNNSNIQRGVRDWSENQTPYIPDSYGQPNADIDGYRSALQDDLTADFSEADLLNSMPNDAIQCGFYDRSTPFEVMNGLCGNGIVPGVNGSIPGTTSDGYGTVVNSNFIAGSYGTSSGFNFQDALNGRLSQLLNTTGEPVILLKRKWTGRRCSCIDLRRENPRQRCPSCFGTGFVGGYSRFYNPNSIGEYIVNTAGYIMIRVSPYQDDLKLEDKQSLRQNVSLPAWTLPAPSIFQRDIIIRYNPNTLVEEFRYECMPVTRNRSLFSMESSQQFVLYRMDKTDVCYQYAIT